MHFHLPKPLHGWREFIGEVGIIVIGVLIALGCCPNGCPTAISSSIPSRT
jgi:hypothetical protein